MSKLKKSKCYVVEVSLLLHDPKAIEILGQHADIILPINVISTLGKLQKSRAFDIGYTAGQALKQIDAIKGTNKKFNGGVAINTRHNLVVMGPNKQNAAHKVDFASQIFGVCENARAKYDQVTLVTKDRALKLEIAAKGIDAEDYEYDMSDMVYSGISKVEDSIYDTSELIGDQKNHNHFLISESGCIQVNSQGKIKTIEKNGKGRFSFHGITARNNGQHAAFWALNNKHIKFVSLQGKAGCGKTFLALVSAIKAITRVDGHDDEKYEKIIITRAMESVDGKEIGALPGDPQDKINPYMEGVWDNIEVIKEYMEKIKDKEEEDASKKRKRAVRPDYASNTKLENEESTIKHSFEKKIKAIPFAFFRGRSLKKTILIVDEAQNISYHAMKMLLTRIDESSMVIIMGDNDQIDNPYLDNRSNGFVRAINHFKNYPLAAHITLDANERGEISNFASLM